jgi:hypothetical protein
MAIIAPQTAPNHATGNYHRINKVDLVCGTLEKAPHYLVYVGFYAHKYGRDDNPQPMYTNVVEIPVSDLEVDPRVQLYQLLLASPLFAGTNAMSDEQ